MNLSKIATLTAILGAISVAAIGCTDASSANSGENEPAATDEAISTATNSAEIAKLVDAIQAMALTKGKKFVIKPKSTTKEALFQIANKLSNQVTQPDFDDSWSSNTNELWTADSTKWGETTEAEAKKYLFDKLDESDLDEEKDWKKYEQKRPAAETAFAKLIKYKGVTFGVGAAGAIQCAVTLAALVIIDSVGGNAYLVSVEPTTEC